MGFPFPLRVARVVGMILKQNPDIIGLQEVDRYDDMEQIFNTAGYLGAIEKKKAKSNPSFNGNGGLSADGSAIFWNTDRLRLATAHDLGLNSGAPDGDDEKDEEDFGFPISNTKFNTLHKGGKEAKQRVLFVTLFDKVLRRPVLAVTAHFKAGALKADRNEKRDMVKEFLTKMDNYRQKYNLLDHPVMFACDFNAARSWGAFKLFYTGACPDEEFQAPKDNWETLPSDELRGPRAAREYLDSAYTVEYHGTKTDENPRHSATKKRRAGDQPDKVGKTDEHTIDFIFHRREDTTVGVLSIPLFKTVRKATKGQFLPHWKYPSDHFMLAADVIVG